MLGEVPRRRDRAPELERGRTTAGPVGRHLRRDGHRQHDGLRDRGDGHDAAGLGDRRPPSRPSGVRIAEATGKRAAEMAKNGGPKPSRDRDARRRSGTRRRCCRRSAARPTASSTSPRWPAALGQRLDYEAFDGIGPRGAGARQPEAVRQPLHGALPRCRRRAAAACRRLQEFLDTRARGRSVGGTVADAIAAAEDCPGPGRDPAALEPDQRRGRAWRCCAATWRRAARSSSSPPRPGSSCSTTGRAVVFEIGRGHGEADGRPGARRHAPTTSSCCATPGRGARPGMPEAGYLPIPKKLAEAGREGHGPYQRRAHERHRLRDDRPAHRARVGGGRPAGARAERRPDPARRPARRIDLLVPDEELAKRAREFEPTCPEPIRGYARLFQEHVTQADEGCDFDFLTREGGSR